MKTLARIDPKEQFTRKFIPSQQFRSNITSGMMSSNAPQLQNFPSAIIGRHSKSRRAEVHVYANRFALKEFANLEQHN